MEHLIFLFAVTVVLASLLAGIGIWSPRNAWIKAGAVATAMLLFAAGYTSLVAMLSLPKPVGFEWAHRHLPEATVLGASIREGEAIYLWLGMADVAEPRAYVLPWDRRLAEQLQASLDEAQANGTGVQMTTPFESSQDPREPKFYALPQPAPPAKDYGAAPPLVYNRPDTGR